QESGLSLRVTETNAASCSAIVPSGRRTAVATRAGERIMTPSMTAWPPTGRNFPTGPPMKRRTKGGMAPSRAFDFRSLGSRLLFRGLFLLGVLAAETLHATGRVDQLLLAGVERMAVGADFHVMVAHRGARLDDVPAHAHDAA